MIVDVVTRAELALPAAMTPAIAGVLGIPNFESGSLADVYRAAGHAIARRLEDEQAFILWRFLPLAIIHGDDWRDFAEADVDAQVATIQARKSCP